MMKWARLALHRSRADDYDFWLEVQQINPYRLKEISRSALVNNNGDGANDLIRAGFVHVRTVISHVPRVGLYHRCL